MPKKVDPICILPRCFKRKLALWDIRCWKKFPTKFRHFNSYNWVPTIELQ